MKPGSHQIDGSLAEDLIRDRDVAVMRVTHIRTITHRQPAAGRPPCPPSLAPDHLRTDPSQAKSRSRGSATITATRPSGEHPDLPRSALWTVADLLAAEWSRITRRRTASGRCQPDHG